MPEFNFTGMQRRSSEFQRKILGKGIFAFAHQRKTEFAKLYADLVGPAGDGLQFHNGKIFLDAFDCVSGYRHPALRILMELSLFKINYLRPQFAFIDFKFSLNEGDVSFGDAFFVKEIHHQLLVFLSLGKDDNSGRIAVQAMARMKAVRVIGGSKIPINHIDEGVLFIFRRWDNQQSGGLVKSNAAIVLIKDFYFALMRLPFRTQASTMMALVRNDNVLPVDWLNN